MATHPKIKNKTVQKSPVKKAQPVKKNPQFLAPIGLAIITLIVYANAFTNGFASNWDDNIYLIGNPYTQNLSQNFFYFFTHFQVGNYHPLSMISLAIDYQLFGQNSAGYHTVNILIHAANVVLLFYFVRLLLKNDTASFVVALLFAVHPMHTESVAWIAERKDVLFFLFFIIGLIFYTRYALGKINRKGYFLALLFFILSVLSKSTAVVFPVILILTDYILKRPFNKIVWLEKVPFFLISLAAGIIAIYAQAGEAALNEQSVAGFTFIDRIFISSYAFLYYIVKTIVPFGLAAMHYYPTSELPWYFYASFPVALALVVMIIMQYKRRPVIFFGGLFFIVSLALTLQLIPVGFAIVAERYVYLAHAGLFIIVGWLISGLNNSKVSKNSGTLIIALFACGIFSLITWQQNKTWANGFTIFDNVVNVYPDHGHAYMARANARYDNNDINGALEDFNKSLSVKYPHEYAITYCNRGNCYYQLKDIDRAMADYNKALQVDSTYFLAYTNRGAIYYSRGENDKAIAEFDHALRFNSQHLTSLSNKGLAYRAKKEYAKSVQCFTMALEVNPSDANVFENRGQAYFEDNKFQQALTDFETSYRLNPSNSNALSSAGVCKYRMGKSAEACNDWRTAESQGNQQAKQFLKDYCK
ncbi:MAG: tetratricopeptide repeat protein [Bacteroidota bacterium]